LYSQPVAACIYDDNSETNTTDEKLLPTVNLPCYVHCITIIHKNGLPKTT